MPTPSPYEQWLLQNSNQQRVGFGATNGDGNVQYMNNTTAYGGPNSDRATNAYKGYLGGFQGTDGDSIAKLLNPDNPYAPGTKEYTFYEKLIKGEKTQEERTTALDKEIRGGYLEMLGEAGKPNQAALTDINRAEVGGKASAYQDLAGRGLGNTTVVNAMQGRVGEAAQRARVGVYDDAYKNKQGVQSQYLNYLNSITNNGPDASIYANLLTGNATGGRKNNSQADAAAMIAAISPIVAALV